MSVLITCINKASGNHENPHVAISFLEWTNESSGEKGRSSRIEIFDWIKNRGGIAYVRDNVGNQVRIGTAITLRGTKYVRTYSDGTWTDNLLSLREC